MDINKALKDGLTKEEILAAIGAEIDEAQNVNSELDEAREEFAKAQVRYYNALGRETNYDNVMQAIKMTEKYVVNPKRILDQESIIDDLFSILDK